MGLGQHFKKIIPEKPRLSLVMNLFKLHAAKIGKQALEPSAWRYRVVGHPIAHRRIGFEFYLGYNLVRPFFISGICGLLAISR
jgi:hypothetical protein